MAPILNEVTSSSSWPSSGQPSTGAGFFIADRLRGIPLVSHGSESIKLMKEQIQRSGGGLERESDNQSSINTMTNNNTSPTSPPADMQITSAHQRSNQVGKRDASRDSFARQHGARIQSDSEILFKQTGITSSIENLVRSTTQGPPQRARYRYTSVTTTRTTTTTTTTTRRPTTTTTRRAQPSRLTTMKRMTTTTTTRKPRPQVVSQRAANSRSNVQLATTTAATTTATKTTTTTTTIAAPRLIEPISSHKMSTLEAVSSDSSNRGSTLPFLVAAPTLLLSAATTTMRPNQQQQSRLSPSLEHIQTTLARSMQTLTTQPVNQRRNQQTVVQSRPGSHRTLSDPRNGYAGENWFLFNRSDGQFSAFEILVLISNILIVCTIFLVILFNWIKAFKKRGAASAAAAGAAAPASGTTQPKGSVEDGAKMGSGGAGQRLDANSDRASKLSLVSSGMSHGTSLMSTSANEATTTQTTSMITANTLPSQQVEGGASAKRYNSGANQKLGESNQQAAPAGATNKAMAIVQPTENNSGNNNGNNLGLDGSLDKLKKDLKAELANGVRPISRSVSDLSGGMAADASARSTAPGEANNQASTTTTPDRVQALEKLFRGTAKKGSEQQQQQQRKKDEADEKRLAHSTSSLDSIELPNNLVDSIKRTAPGPLRTQVDPSLAPSPNLLLGEVGSAAGDQALKAAAGPGKDRPTPVATAANATNDMLVDGSRPQNPMADVIATKGPTGGGDAPTGRGKPDKPATGGLSGEPERRAQRVGAREDGGKPVANETSEKQPVKQQSQQQQQQQKQQQKQQQQQQQQPQQTAEVKNHQVVVNRLDKRKTNLEIVDLRDESVTGKMRRAGDKLVAGGESGEQAAASDGSAWISMDGVAVVQPHSIAPDQAATAATAAAAAAGNQLTSPVMMDAQTANAVQMAATMSPSEIIESRFHVDYKSKRRQQQQQQYATVAADGSQQQQQQQVKNTESMDSKQEEYVFNNIENELELDNKLRNRKYFVYVVHDGHFTTKKECIARIELPQKRRITLAELRQLISNSQDISLSSLRRNRFKFVTETYRLLNENEDAAVLHQVYPTQGVFLKLNVAEQENQVYSFKGGRSARLSSGGGGSGGGGANSLSATPAGSSLSNTTIASRRRANARAGGARNAARPPAMADGSLPAIEVDSYYGSARAGASGLRASSVGRPRQGGGPGDGFKRSKSSVQVGRRAGGSGGATSGPGGGLRRGASGGNLNVDQDESLPAIGMLPASAARKAGRAPARRTSVAPKRRRPSQARSALAPRQTIGGAASDLGANMISGAKKLLSSTFGL